MRLIKTRLDRKINSLGDQIYLGAWAKEIYDNSVTIKYHWDDRSKYYKDYKYLTNLYKKNIKFLTVEFNKIHKINESERYWEIVIGPWLRTFTDAIFDRYEITQSIKKEKIRDIFLFNYGKLDFIPNDFKSFFFNYTEDEWNEFIFAECIKYSGIRFKKYEQNIKLKSLKKSKSSKNIIKYFVKKVSNLIPSFLNKISFVSSYLPLSRLIKIQLKLLQLPYLLAPDSPKIESKIDLKLRASINTNYLIGKNDFEKFLSKILKLQIPVIYLESFYKLRKSVLANYPKNPRIIFTGVGYQANDMFKIWSAEKIKNGCKLYIAQHGGNVGISKWNQAEDHQIRIADKYISWGWQEDGKPNVTPLPSPYLNKKIKFKRDGNIIFAIPNLPRYFYQSYSVPVAGQFEICIKEQIKLLNLFTKKAKNITKIKLVSPKKLGWELDKFFLKNGYGANIIKNNLNFTQNANNCRLSVHTHNATTFIETLEANFPTILYLNKRYYELRDSSKGIFDELMRVKIFFDNIEETSCFINQNYNDIEKWWYDDSLQKVRKKFLSEYAISKNWERELHQLFRENY